MLKTLILKWLKSLVNDLIDEFLKNLAQAQGAPPGVSYLSGPEVEIAKEKTSDHLWN